VFTARYELGLLNQTDTVSPLKGQTTWVIITPMREATYDEINLSEK